MQHMVFAMIPYRRPLLVTVVSGLGPLPQSCWPKDRVGYIGKPSSSCLVKLQRRATHFRSCLPQSPDGLVTTTQRRRLPSFRRCSPLGLHSSCRRLEDSPEARDMITGWCSGRFSGLLVSRALASACRSQNSRDFLQISSICSYAPGSVAVRLGVPSQDAAEGGLTSVRHGPGVLIKKPSSPCSLVSPQEPRVKIGAYIVRVGSDGGFRSEEVG